MDVPGRRSPSLHFSTIVWRLPVVSVTQHRLPGTVSTDAQKTALSPVTPPPKRRNYKSSLFLFLFLLAHVAPVSVDCRIWRPIDHGQSYHVFGASPEADAPGGDAEAFTCAIVCPRGDSGAQCFGLDLGGCSFAGGKHGAEPGDRNVDLLGV
jgi:hypothetical protein